MKIGWIGLGKMGLPIAQRLAAAGHKVTAYVRNDAGKTRAVDAGLAHVSSIEEVARGADVVVSAISDDDALAAIVGGPSGLAAKLKSGQVYIDTSTVSPSASKAAARLLEPQGIHYLRAPVSGSIALAATGVLTVMVSGPREQYDRLEPVFATFSRKSFHLGSAEEARVIKLVLNSLVAATSALFGEVLAFGCKGGLDLKGLLEVIGESAVASPLIQYKRNVILEGSYEPNFTVSQMMKDIDIVLSVGRSNHVPMPLVAQIREQYETAYVNGNGERDFFVLTKEAAARAGV